MKKNNKRIQEFNWLNAAFNKNGKGKNIIYETEKSRNFEALARNGP
jgi:hypothetical protein